MKTYAGMMATLGLFKTFFSICWIFVITQLLNTVLVASLELESLASKRLTPEDPATYSRPDVAKVVDLFIKLDIDFSNKILNGSVVLTVEKLEHMATHVILDSDYLSIYKVTNEKTGEDLDYNIASRATYFGSKFTISLPNEDEKRHKIRIDYSTSPNSSALNWMTPAQTAGKTHPYLFSLCQAIHCRTIIPLQDTSLVKATYSAEITAPEEFTVLMSAIRQGTPEKRNGKKLYRFLQKVPIPSYLIAIAAGKLESRKIGPRSHVWSEKELVDKAAYEFATTESMLQAAEDMLGPYVWGVYDILVLPPSFAFGGMEHPCMTFVSTTVLVGDRSLTFTVAHEIGHSWTGNLVTNKNLEHFWLNEGFTVFIHEKLMGRIEQGEASRSLAAMDSWKTLKTTIDAHGKDNPKNALVVNQDGKDPDSTYSYVPYGKGAFFLWYLEHTVRGPGMFEPFLRSYIEKFKYQSIDSYQFKDFFLEYFLDPAFVGLFDKSVGEIDWDLWLTTPGMPTFKPTFDESLAKVCTELKDKWVKWSPSEPVPFSENDLKNFTTSQKIEFLGQLVENAPFSIAKLAKIQELYDFDTTPNLKLKFLWTRLGLLSKWEGSIPLFLQVASASGRVDYLRPLYRDIYNWEEKKEFAIQTFRDKKVEYAVPAVKAVEGVLDM